MNSISPNHKINSYQDLQDERRRLEEVIKVQKLRIRHDIDELKEEAKNHLKPVIDAAEFVKKLAVPATRNDTLLGIGTNLTLEVLIRRLFAKSSMLVQLIFPTIVKNYSTHLLRSLLKNLEEKRQLKQNTVKQNGKHEENILY
jgi:hypothetical protein